MKKQKPRVEDIRDRIATIELTPELVREWLDSPEEEEVREAIQRFEDNYNAIAWAEENDRYYRDESGYTVHALAGTRADRDEIKRGMQSIYHWLDPKP